jgi:large subunit ribosomal protein L21
MKYIIIEASGRQYWVESGKFIDMNNLSIQSGSKISIHRVFFGKNEEDIFIGKPYLPNIKVEALVQKHFLGPKIIVYKMKPKKKYRRKNGHRQQLSRVFIEKITF